MRIITSYAYTLDVETTEEAASRFLIYQGIMDDWLRDQGISDPRENSPADTFVQLKRRDVSHEGTEIDGFLLKQPVLESSHLLNTRFDLAVADESLALFLQFSLERKTSRIAPVSYPVSCPRALQTILDAGNWKSGQARVRPHSRRLFGQEAGKGLQAEIEDPDRALPIVLLANFPDNKPRGEYQKLIEPYDEDEWEDFVNRVEDDLGGVALLVELDKASDDALLPPAPRIVATEERTHLGGRLEKLRPTLRPSRRRAMGGAVVRIIWPLGTDRFDQHRHPAWAPSELFAHPDVGTYWNDNGENTEPPEWMGTFERDQLMLLRRFVRDQIYEQAALQPVPRLIDDVREQCATAERERLAAERKRLAEENSFEEWGRLYEDELKAKVQEIETRNQEIALQRGELDRLQNTVDELQSTTDKQQATIAQLKFQLNERGAPTETGEQVDDATTSREPGSVAEVIEITESECELVVFGPDVLSSIRSLDPTAGPPGKILRDLKTLNECSEALTQGHLGQDILDWLKKKGVNVARESDTRIRKHQDRLTFKTLDGDTALMGNHISYKGNSLNRQVRIHFRLREADSDGKRSFEVGYIGPKIAEE